MCLSYLGVMRVEILTALALAALFLVSTQGQVAAPAGNIDAGEDWRSEVGEIDLRTIDIAQRTCALDVILKTFALDGAGAPIQCAEPSLEHVAPRSEEPMLACRPALEEVPG